LEKIGNVHFLKCKFDPKSAFFFLLEKSPNFQNHKTDKKQKTLDVSPQNAFREGTILLLSCFISNGMFAIS
jgi:hypothetical protein